MSYAILESNGLCSNIIVWDGVAPFDLPNGCQLIENNGFKIGKIYFYDENTQNWILSNTEEPSITEDDLLILCDYFAFWDALIVSNVYQKIRSQAIIDINLNMCCTEFIAAISDAKYAKANKNAIQTCINLLLNAANLNQQDIFDLENILKIGNMDKVYILQ